ncbi:hypothetical protein [Pseudomonas sp. PB3P13]
MINRPLAIRPAISRSRAIRHDSSQPISSLLASPCETLVKVSEEAGIEQGVMRKFGKRNITDVVGFKTPEQMN